MTSQKSCFHGVTVLENCNTDPLSIVFLQWHVPLTSLWTNDLLQFFVFTDPVANISITMEKDAEDFVFGEPVTFTCSVQHGTSPSFIWFHNEEVVEQRSMFYQLKDNQKRLYIDSLQIHHRGTYQCKASNKLSPNRTFSVLSAPRNINFLEPSPTGKATYVIKNVSLNKTG